MSYYIKTLFGGIVFLDMLFFIKFFGICHNIVFSFLHFSRSTWMNEYHMQRNFTNPMHIEALLAQALK